MGIKSLGFPYMARATTSFWYFDHSDDNNDDDDDMIPRLNVFFMELIGVAMA
jgi:hypothetical protein